MTGRLMVLALVAALGAGRLAAQQSDLDPRVRAAMTAYEELRYGDAIRQARQLVGVRLPVADQVASWEVLAFSLAALDSTGAAVEAFKQLIFLDPNREPNVEFVAPRIVNAYTSALGDVLVIRRVEVDSTVFVASEGAVAVRFEVSRPSRAQVRLVGTGVDIAVDSFLVARRGQTEWRAVMPDGSPVPAGDYQLILTAVERDNQHAATVPLHVAHGRVDTVPHLLALPGQSLLPEMESPPRTFLPLGIAVLYTGIAAGAAVGLENGQLGIGGREAISGVSGLAVLTGIIMSLRKPDPRPVIANIRYNQLLRSELVRRNMEIANRNAELRRQVRLTVWMTEGGAP